MARYAVVQNKIVQNIAVWDEVSPWNVSGFEEVKVTGQAGTYIGSAIHDRSNNSYTHNIVIEGNSIARALGVDPVLNTGLSQYNSINMAKDGWTTTDLQTVGVAQIDSLYEPSLGVKNILVVLEIGNDLGLNASRTDAQAYNNLKTYCQARKTKGWQIVVVTCLPRKTGVAANLNANFETYRLSVNQMIRDAKIANETWLNAVADIGANATIGASANTLNTSLYYDGIHPTLSSNQIINALVSDSLGGLL